MIMLIQKRGAYKSRILTPGLLRKLAMTGPEQKIVMSDLKL
jgi:hypothetical protein